MIEVNALIVFYSRYGATERLGLVCGVGAIQARANVRIRRLPDHADQAEIDRDPSWKENLTRMTPDYIAPRDIDAQWADLLLLAAPLDEVSLRDDVRSGHIASGVASAAHIPEAVALAEMCRYLRSLKVLGGMSGKLAAVITGAGPIYADAAQAGFMVIPPPAEPGFSDPKKVIAHARRVAELTRTLKSAAQA
jgi:hypothetical protein